MTEWDWQRRMLAAPQGRTSAATEAAIPCSAPMTDTDGSTVIRIRVKGTNDWYTLQQGESIVGRNSKVSVLEVRAPSCSREQAVISWIPPSAPSLTVRGQTPVTFSHRTPPVSLNKGDSLALQHGDRWVSLRSQRGGFQSLSLQVSPALH